MTGQDIGAIFRMRASFQIGVAILLTTVVHSAAAWEYVHLDVGSGRSEAQWRRALASRLAGEQEVGVLGGRVDILTETFAVEVDRLAKWHEGVGQVLHYADETERMGMLALMVSAPEPERLAPRDLATLNLVERQCRRLDIRLLVLFRGGEEGAGALMQFEAVDPPGSPVYWLNGKSKVRHNTTCRYYGKTANGRACTHEEGRPCSICGG